jgi:hypothetical protein
MGTGLQFSRRALSCGTRGRTRGGHLYRDIGTRVSSRRLQLGDGSTQRRHAARRDLSVGHVQARSSRARASRRLRLFLVCSRGGRMSVNDLFRRTGPLRKRSARQAVSTKARKVARQRERRRVAARGRAAEQRVLRAVRAAVMARDGGTCRASGTALGIGLGACEGPLELAHLAAWRRSRTRGQPPEQRHTRTGAISLCHAHHVAYDAHRFDILLGPTGADGPVGWKLNDR